MSIVRRGREKRKEGRIINEGKKKEGGGVEGEKSNGPLLFFFIIHSPDDDAVRKGEKGKKNTVEEKKKEGEGRAVRVPFSISIIPALLLHVRGGRRDRGRGKKKKRGSPSPFPYIKAHKRGQSQKKGGGRNVLSLR